MGEWSHHFKVIEHHVMYLSHHHHIMKWKFLCRSDVLLRQTFKRACACRVCCVCVCVLVCSFVLLSCVCTVCGRADCVWCAVCVLFAHFYLRFTSAERTDRSASPTWMVVWRVLATLFVLQQVSTEVRASCKISIRSTNEMPYRWTATNVAFVCCLMSSGR